MTLERIFAFFSIRLSEEIGRDVNPQLILDTEFDAAAAPRVEDLLVAKAAEEYAAEANVARWRSFPISSKLFFIVAVRKYSLTKLCVYCDCLFVFQCEMDRECVDENLDCCSIDLRPPKTKSEGEISGRMQKIIPRNSRDGEWEERSNVIVKCQVFKNCENLQNDGNDHTSMTAPLPVCSAKLSMLGLG